MPPAMFSMDLIVANEELDKSIAGLYDQIIKVYIGIFVQLYDFTFSVFRFATFVLLIDFSFCSQPTRLKERVT